MLDPAALPALRRHPAILAARPARPRRQGVELLWLDDADGTLAGQELVLEQPRRAPPRLRRLRPPEREPGCPGVPDATLPPPEDLAGVMPLAGFSGRRMLLAETGGEAPVRVELLTGQLRAVAATAQVNRLLLGGPAPAVLDLARRLAAELPLLPAAAGLAEEARALARGEAPRPRRAGPPLLAGAATLEEAFAYALGHLLEVMLAQAPRCRLGQGPEGVHQLRVALRRLRSVLKLLRPAVLCPAVRSLDERLRALAKLLGPARDWDVFLAGLGAEVAAAFPGEPRLARLLRAAALRRAAGYEALEAALEGPEFRLLLLDGIALLAGRLWREGAEESGRAVRLAMPPAEFGAALLRKRWRRLRRDGEAIEELAAEALHELRLDAKRLRYAAELFGPLWPGKAPRRLLRRLAALQDSLGLANDVAVARGLVASLGSAAPGWAVGAAEGYAVARLGRTRKAAVRCWEKLMLAKPFWDDV